MAISLNDNVTTLAPKASDNRFGTYGSVAEAVASIDKIVRFRGLTLGVISAGVVSEYWFRNGIEDSDLILKTYQGSAMPEHVFILPVTADDEDVSVGTSLFHFRTPFSAQLIGVRASLTLEPEQTPLLVDLKRNGVSILSSPIQVDTGTLTSYVSLDPLEIALDSLGKNAELTIDVTQVGDLQPGKGLKLYLLMSVRDHLCDIPPYYCSTGVNPYCVTDFTDAWAYCYSLGTFPLLNVSSGTNFTGAWAYCTSLTSFPTLNTSSGTNFQGAWFYCTSLTSFPALNLSSGTNFDSAWYNCSSLTSFPLLDVSSGTNFQEAWIGCSSLTSFPALDVSSGTDFNSAWAGCSSLTSFPALDVSSGINFDFAWAYCTSLTSFPLLDVSSGTDFSWAWDHCTGLTSFPTLNVSSGTDFSWAWEHCTGLTSFPALDVSSGINFDFAWAYCSGLTSFPLLDVSSGTKFNFAWWNCTSLTSFPLLDVSSGTEFGVAWSGCTSLTSFPALDVSSGIDFSFTWAYCTSLTSFPAGMFDSCSATNFSGAWLECALDQTSVDNILVSLDTAGQSNGTVSLNGGTSAAPSATGLAAKANLVARGWIVGTN